MWSRSSASAAGSAVALCGARGVHRLLTCVASPARRRAAGKAKSIPRSALRASVTPDAVTAAPDEAIEESSVEQAAENKLSKLACPICYYPLVSSSDQSAKFGAASSLECSTCKKFYPNRGDYWDMTVAVGSTEYSESTTVTTEVFRTPLVSFLYERGWRQNFIWGGFPGLEREFEMAKTYLKPTTGGIIVDASCGSGLFSRLFVKSELYSHVVALDFSENMLKQCNEFVKQENISDKTLALVRADISRLPFVSGSIDAVHAAAAIHCWPSPACAVAEISRVLRPGGVFVASTFVADILPPAVPVLRIGRPYISQFTGSNIFLSEAEFEDLCRACGLVDFTILRALSSWTNSFT
uniref:Methyltransferase type 11 domain-containing protein n=1 Tax=Oryza punctata TaxID=4537 RepID=A0A0E0LV06_ORYPU